MAVKRDLYILCGGESIRMGTNKSRLPVDGKTILDHLTERVLPLFKSVTLLSGTKMESEQLPQLPDVIPDAGPLSGLLAALKQTSADSIALLPVDLPLVSDDTLKQLNSPVPAGAEACFAESPARIQPLVGIYLTRIRPQLEAYLGSGRRSVMGFTESIPYETFAVAEQEMLNINTPEDYRLYLDMGGRR